MENEEFIKRYLKENLSISVDINTNDFMSTDGSERTRITIKILLDNEEVCSDICDF